MESSLLDMICSLHTHGNDTISKIKYNSEPCRTSTVFSEDSHLSQQDLPGEEENFRSWKAHDVLSIFGLSCCISITQLIFEAKEQNGYYYIVFM